MAHDFSSSGSTAMLTNVLKKAEKIRTDGKKYDIDVNDFVMNDKNEYIFGMDDIDRLADNIKKLGFHGAIEAFSLPNGKYEIFSGHRRYLAAKKTGMKTIPTIVMQNVDEETKLLLLITSNLEIRDKTPLIYARSINELKRYYKDKGVRVREAVAESLNISPAMVYRYDCINKMIPELQALCDDSRFPYSAFSFAGNFTTEQQKDLYDMIKAYVANKKKELGDDSELNISIAEIEELINKIKSKHNIITKSDKMKENNEKKPKKTKDTNSIEDLIHKDVPTKKTQSHTPVISIELEGTEENMIASVDEDILIYIDRINAYLTGKNKIENPELIVSKITELLNKIK